MENKAFSFFLSHSCNVSRARKDIASRPCPSEIVAADLEGGLRDDWKDRYDWSQAEPQYKAKSLCKILMAHSGEEGGPPEDRSIQANCSGSSYQVLSSR